jgi:tetratricopeptide (TPR) repeat protein
LQQRHSQRSGLNDPPEAERRAPLARATLIAACVLLISACAIVPEDPRLDPEYAALLTGEVIFGEPVSTDEVPAVELLSVSDEMRAFIATEVGDVRVPALKFRRMFRGLSRDGYFNASYIADSTRTAAETFHHKSGNCLSYTSMFIALAREAGLDARYQIVQVPPNWDADSGYLIRYTHVNVVLKGFTYNASTGEEFSVDFNDVLPDPDYPRFEISDERASSLFYANQSVFHMRSGNMRPAFAYLKKAIDIAPENADLWINLGAFYAKQGAFEPALAAYEVALGLDPGNRGAISGLGRTHETLGNAAEAELYNDKVRRYRQRNPYYHFAIAQTEFDRARYAAALAAINTAIDLKYRNGRFHFLKGLTEYKLGDLESAQTSFRRADRFGNYRDLKQRYVDGVAQAEPPKPAPN